jgi:hypothetical protein
VDWGPRECAPRWASLVALVILLVSFKKARDVIGIITYLNDKPFALMAVFFERGRRSSTPRGNHGSGRKGPVIKDVKAILKDEGEKS